MSRNNTISSPEDKLLAEYRKSGDQEVLGRIFNNHMHLVYGLCLKYLKSRVDSQDAVMSIYEKVSESLLKTKVTNFKSWLYMVSKNYCLMQLRKKNPEINAEVVMESQGIVHPIDREEVMEQQLDTLEDCIKKLKSDQQRCVRLFFLQSKSYHEVHELTGLTLQKVKSHIQNGKRNLKSCLESNYVEQ